MDMRDLIRRIILETLQARYPLDAIDKWYGDADYAQRGGRLEWMSPDAFLARSKPLVMDDATRENIDDLKAHIQDGGKLDPLALYNKDISNVRSSDGRHRAVACKELGIDPVPVVVFP